MQAHRWSNIIKLLAASIVVLGLFMLAYGVVSGLAWADFVVGGLAVFVGLLGVYAGFRPSLGAAKRYFWALILMALVMIGVLVVFIIVVDQTYWVELCHKESIDWGDIRDCDSETTRWIFVAAAIIQLIITLCCCTCCVCCARTYYKVLAKEDGYHAVESCYGPSNDVCGPGPYHTAPQFSSMRSFSQYSASLGDINTMPTQDDSSAADVGSTLPHMPPQDAAIYETAQPEPRPPVYLNP